MKKDYKILIVDDDAEARSLYVEIFKSEGFEVTEAVDGIDGMDKATASIPDVIFTGIIMPRMDGFGLKEALAKNVATSNIPVVMSSHMGREEDRKKAMEVGVRDFFVVGMITPREVVSRILDLFSAEKYRLYISTKGDVSRLVRDLRLKGDFSCVVCGDELALDLKITNIEKWEFTGKIICPRCEAK
jgi:PleD family two-component response regulator